MSTSISDLGAEAARQHRDFGAGSLIVCDRLVRIYIAAGIEVQALQGLDLLVEATTVSSPSTSIAPSPGSTRRRPCHHRRAASTSPTTPSSSGGTGIISNQEDNTPSSRSVSLRQDPVAVYGHPAFRVAPGYLDQPDDAYLPKRRHHHGGQRIQQSHPVHLTPRSGHRPDRERGRRPRTAHFDCLSERRYTPLRRECPRLRDQRLVGRRVHAHRQTGLDRPLTERRLPVRPPAGGAGPLPDDRLQPAARAERSSSPDRAAPGATTSPRVTPR